MAFLANTAFLPRKWNNRNNDLQNITGRYGTQTVSAFTGADCSAGQLAKVIGACSPGVAKMTAALDGTTDVYACNPSDVNRVSQGDNLWAVGSCDLGIGLAADVNGTFTRLIPGETYAFGAGNFTSAPTGSTPYAVIASGRLTPAEEIPETASTIYFKQDDMLSQSDMFTQGNTGVFARYNLLCLKTPDYIEE